MVPINTTTASECQEHVMRIQETSMITDLPTVETTPVYTCQEPHPWEEITTEEIIFEEPTTEAEIVTYEEPSTEYITEEPTEETIVADAEVVTGYVVPFEWGCSWYGTMDITAYCSGSICADGSAPSVGYTAACNDPYLWHKWVYIEGVGDRYICDTGGMSGNVIDIFVGSYDEAVGFGRQSKGVYVYE